MSNIKRKMIVSYIFYDDDFLFAKLFGIGNPDFLFALG